MSGRFIGIADCLTWLCAPLPLTIWPNYVGCLAGSWFPITNFCCTNWSVQHTRTSFNIMLNNAVHAPIPLSEIRSLVALRRFVRWAQTHSTTRIEMLLEITSAQMLAYTHSFRQWFLTIRCHGWCNACQYKHCHNCKRLHGCCVLK